MAILAAHVAALEQRVTPETDSDIFEAWASGLGSVFDATPVKLPDLVHLEVHPARR